MFRWLFFCAVLCGGAFYLVSLAVPKFGLTVPQGDPSSEPVSADVRTAATVPSITFEGASDRKDRIKPLIIPGAHIVVNQQTEVGSDRSGRIMFYGTELKPGEEKTLPASRIIPFTFIYLAVEVSYDTKAPAQAYPLTGTPPGETPFLVPVRVGGENNYFYLENGSPRVYTRWKEGMPLHPNHVRIVEENLKFRMLEDQDRVEKGALLALIDPSLARTEVADKVATLDKNEADRIASEKTREEARARVAVLDFQLTKTPGGVSKEEYRAAELNVARYTQEEIAKRADIKSTETKLVGAMKVLAQHEVRAAISGVVKGINKNRGDSVKENQDTLLRIVNPTNLRAEAMAGVEDVQQLYKGQGVTLELATRVTPTMTLSGPHREINAVAVTKGDRSKGEKSLIIAASEDQTLRAWDAKTGHETWTPRRMPSAVRALACTGKDVEKDLLLIGCSDGSSYVYDFADPAGKPVMLPERHRGPITAVAFSPDGSMCATAGEDRAIITSAFNDGKWTWVQTIADAHRAAVTSLAFTVLPESKEWRLISAGRDNVLIVWKAEKNKPLVKEEGSVLSRRSGDVTQLGASGDRILFDSGKELRVVSLSERQIEGTLRNASTAATFSTMALFSPDGRTILTNGGTEGRPQLWRAPPRLSNGKDPLAMGRGSELRNLASKSMATCGAFDPAGEFCVTGTQDGQVLVWSMPSTEEIEKRIPATILLVEKFLEVGSQVRVWAELKETPPWLVPGSMATIIVVPDEAAK